MPPAACSNSGSSASRSVRSCANDKAMILGGEQSARAFANAAAGPGNEDHLQFGRLEGRAAAISVRDGLQGSAFRSATLCRPVREVRLALGRINVSMALVPIPINLGDGRGWLRTRMATIASERSDSCRTRGILLPLAWSASRLAPNEGYTQSALDSVRRAVTSRPETAAASRQQGYLQAVWKRRRSAAPRNDAPRRRSA